MNANIFNTWNGQNRNAATVHTTPKTARKKNKLVNASVRATVQADGEIRVGG